jgi:AbrB family looped-hinge helix DNA binding protein
MTDGRIDAMKATIDAAGRVVIPKKIRDQAGLRPGTPLDVRLVDGKVEIEPEYLPVKFVREGRLLVAVPLVPVEPLTSEEVERVRQEIYEERAREIAGQ